MCIYIYILICIYIYIHIIIHIYIYLTLYIIWVLYLCLYLSIDIFFVTNCRELLSDLQSFDDSWWFKIIKLMRTDRFGCLQVLKITCGYGTVLGCSLDPGWKPQGFLHPCLNDLCPPWALDQSELKRQQLSSCALWRTMENLRYSKTFIDVEEVNESSAVRRAYSAPPVNLSLRIQFVILVI